MKRRTRRPFSGPVSAASQPANCYTERTAWHPAGAPGSEQFSLACHEIVRGCRCEYRHPTLGMHNTPFIFKQYVFLITVFHSDNMKS
jgi:hypothetical protein